jgi:hypothetical protein
MTPAQAEELRNFCCPASAAPNTSRPIATNAIAANVAEQGERPETNANQ